VAGTTDHNRLRFAAQRSGWREVAPLGNDQRDLLAAGSDDADARIGNPKQFGGGRVSREVGDEDLAASSRGRDRQRQHGQCRDSRVVDSNYDEGRGSARPPRGERPAQGCCHLLHLGTTHGLDPAAAPPPPELNGADTELDGRAECPGHIVTEAQPVTDHPGEEHTASPRGQATEQAGQRVQGRRPDV
jgi:hypothetical protein